MKITLAYLPAEDEEAAAVLAAPLRLHPRAKLRKSDRHAPFLHLYLTIGKAAKMGRKSEDSHCI